MLSGETFFSDFDQRHSLSVYALYRLSNRSSLGAKFRYGSNYPITGYVGEQAVSQNSAPLFGGVGNVAEAVVRIFHRFGDYEHRQRNRLKFTVKALGWDGFRARFEEALTEFR